MDSVPAQGQGVGAGMPARWQSATGFNRSRAPDQAAGIKAQGIEPVFGDLDDPALV